MFNLTETDKSRAREFGWFMIVCFLVYILTLNHIDRKLDEAFKGQDRCPPCIMLETGIIEDPASIKADYLIVDPSFKRGK